MFELAGSKIEKGEFEIRLEKVVPAWKKPFVKLGPIRGRLVALFFILVGGVFTFTKQPGSLFVQRGWVQSAAEALRVQQLATWATVGVGVLIYFLVVIFRQKKVSLFFHKGSKEFRYFIEPAWAAQRAEEGLFVFDDLTKFEVFGSQRSAGHPHGYIELAFESAPRNTKRGFKFRLLTDEQLKIYPANLARIMEKTPVGDWTDPDDLPQSPR